MKTEFTSTQAHMAVEINSLSRSFGSKVALHQLCLSVPTGGVFGLVGLNGAGKTTLLKHIMGLYRAEPGRVSVLGGDPARQPESVLKEVGYLTEEDTLPGWMKVGQLIRFYEPFYPTWDQSYAKELLDTFSLQPNDRIRDLSKGQRARAALLIALAHRPKLLVLDEPSSGLDPVVRGDILEAIIRTIADSGRTVIFSSHLLDEVQRISDYVAVIHGGEVLEAGETSMFESRFKRVTYRFSEAFESPPKHPHLSSWTGSGSHWSAVADTNFVNPTEPLDHGPSQVIAVEGMSLHEWFVSRVGSHATAA